MREERRRRRMTSCWIGIESAVDVSRSSEEEDEGGGRDGGGVHAAEPQSVC